MEEGRPRGGAEPYGPIWERPLHEVAAGAAGALREVAGELPEAAGRGPAAVAEVLMREDRRPYLGVVLAGLALALLLFGS